MPRILLIEDNFEIRENTTEILELEGFDVLAAENGTDGLAAAQAHLPDLILCDIMMPGTDGYQVLEELRKNVSTAAIPFIFVSANAEKRTIRAAIALGANGYVHKPFETETLLAEIGRCLDNR